MKRLYIFLLVIISAFAVMFSSACAKDDTSRENDTRQEQNIDNGSSNKDDEDYEDNSDNSGDTGAEDETDDNINDNTDNSGNGQENNTDENDDNTSNNAAVEVTEIIIDQSFYNFQIYVGAEVDLSLFNATIYFIDNSFFVVYLGDIYTQNLDTSSAGTKDFTIVYDGEIFVKHYEVTSVYITSITAKQNNIVAYFNEANCLDNIEFEVTYNNGDKETFKLSDATGMVDVSEVTETPLTAKFVYKGFEFSFEYTVTIRQIEENEYYELVDQNNIFAGLDIQIITISYNNENELMAYFLRQEQGQPVYSGGLTNIGNGRYQMAYSTMGPPKLYEIFAYENKVIIREKQA
ncbi:MAG: hypothetical protein IJS74_03995 [Clostridia bacterium]|nr:hypothetical protein [Clostridia bacterium]